MNSTPANAPLVVELGRKKGKQIRRLRKGEGPLMDEVAQIVDQLRSEGRLAKGAVPVAMVVKQKASCQSLFKLR
jgi:hypothetical protein